MRKIIYLSFLFFITGLSAQKMKTIYLNKDVTTHFLSKVHIDKYDLSTKIVVGQLFNKKVLAIKPINNEEFELGVLSIIGQDYFIQYRLKYTNSIDRADKKVELSESKENYFLHPNFELTNIAIQRYARQIKRLSRSYNNTSSKANRTVIKLNNIIVKDRYIFIDYSIKNKSNLMYDVDDIKFSIEDRKQTKNTNTQRQLLTPIFSQNKDASFKRNYRNVVCLDKITFPDNKVMVVELSEKQISGRTIKLYINYLDILNADTL